MANVSSDAFKPNEVLGVDPLDFIGVMQSMSCAASVVAEFGEVNVKEGEFDGPPLAQRILGAIGQVQSLETLFPTQATTHLNILLAKKTDNKPWTHCHVAHTICVLAGEMQASKVELCTPDTNATTPQKVDDSKDKEGYSADAKAAPKAPAAPTEAGNVTTLQPGDLMTSDGEQWYATSSDKPCLAVVFTVGEPLLAGKKLCKISLAKVAQLAKNGGGDWRLDADGKEIDWAADGALKNGEVVGQAPAPTAPSTTGAAPSPPVLVQGAFNAEEVLGTSDAAFGGVIRSLSTIMPMQVHFEPEAISGNSGPGLVRRAVDAVTKLEPVKELLDNAGSDNVRLKMRFSGGGKFIHRNRYPRRQAFCLVSGEMTWFLVDSQNNGGAADEFLGCIQNDNWNGYRSPPHPKMLSLEEMAEMQEKLPAGVESRIIKMKAGDVLVFDGRWWHATNYNQQAFSIFLTPGKDMEVAVKEQERRRKMPKQAKLKICSFGEA